MYSSKTTLTALVALFLLALLSTAAAQSDSVPSAPFVTSIDQAKQLGADRSEKALLLFYTDW